MPKVVSGLPHDCPRCGAPLPPATQGRTVCKYCRNAVHIDTARKQHPASRTFGPFPWFKAQWLWTVLVVLVGGAWQVQRLLATAVPVTNLSPAIPIPTQEVAASPTAPSLPPAELVTRIEGKLLLINAVNDAQQDCAALARIEGTESGYWIVAINGRTGRTIWHYALPGGVRPSAVELATTGDSVIVRMDHKLVHLRAKDGQVVWQAETDATAGKVCATNAYVAISGDTPPTNVWDWKSGRALQVKPGRCEPLYSTESAGSNFDYVEAEGSSKLVAATRTFSALRGLIPHQGNARVILGSERKGAEDSPVVGVVTNRRWVWRQEVAESTLAAFPTPAIAAVRRESVVVPYWDSQNKGFRLAAFGLEHGRRLWDIALEEHTALPSKTDIDVVISLDGAVFSRTLDGRLSAYTLSTGTPLWSIGGA